MIGFLHGEVISVGENHIIISTGGVGYVVFVTPATLGGISTDTEVSYWIHTAVREDTLDLYGFETREGRDFFKLLIGVSGIGPKTALGVLSLAPARKIISAIASEDTSYLTNVSGIGKKSAQKIVLELKDKLGELEYVGTSEARTQESETVHALTSMGYSAQEARDAIKEIDDEIQETSERIRAALKILGT